MRDKILGYAFLALAFLAVMSLIYYFEVVNQEPVEVPNHQKSELRSYTNQEYDFSLEFPNTYRLKENSDAENYLTKNGKTIARIDMPKDSYPGTNFSEGYATIAVAVNADPKDCDKYVTGANQTKNVVGTLNINTINFRTAEFNGAGAGNFYETKLYRNFAQSNCYEIALTLHTTNVGNYEPGTVTEVDKNQVWMKLDEVLKTFKFIK